MKAWAIFVHSVRQVFGNLGAALRISVVPFLLVVVIVLGAVALGMPANGGRLSSGMVLALLLIVAIYVVALVSIAVNWHRHILLAEPVGWVPVLRGGRVLAYLGRLILVALVMVVAGFLALALLMSVSGHQVGVSAMLVIPVMLGALTLNWRLATALPGAATGGGRGFAEAWAATRGQWPTLLALSAIYLGAALAVGLLVGLLAFIPVIGALADLAASWAWMMVGLSVLTTLYGHYVEGRPLV